MVCIHEIAYMYMYINICSYAYANTLIYGNRTNEFIVIIIIIIYR